MKYTDDYFKEAEKVIMGVLHKVRPELMAAFGNITFDTKKDKTPVTELDHHVETLLKAALKKFDSTAGILGEESGQEGSTENYWLIDPIDGTEGFIRGIPTSRNQLAFVSNDQIEFALCYRFPTEDLYVARRGAGTTKNGKKITITSKPLKRCWLEMSVNLTDPKTYEDFTRLRACIDGISVTRDYPMVVEGLLDGMITGSEGGPWDYLPRALLLTEAGWRVGNYGSLDFDIHTMSLVAAHPDNFEAIQKLLSPQA